MLKKNESFKDAASLTPKYFRPKVALFCRGEALHNLARSKVLIIVDEFVSHFMQLVDNDTVSVSSCTETCRIINDQLC
jgi:hypothetical protein